VTAAVITGLVVIQQIRRGGSVSFLDSSPCRMAGRCSDRSQRREPIRPKTAAVELIVPVREAAFPCLALEDGDACLLKGRTPGRLQGKRHLCVINVTMPPREGRWFGTRKKVTCSAILGWPVCQTRKLVSRFSVPTCEHLLVPSVNGLEGRGPTAGRPRPHASSRRARRQRERQGLFGRLQSELRRSGESLVPKTLQRVTPDLLG